MESVWSIYYWGDVVTSAGDLELERQIRSDAGEIRDGVGPFTLALDSPCFCNAQ